MSGDDFASFCSDGSGGGGGVRRRSGIAEGTFLFVEG